jgi:hypothetical protein
MKGKWIGKKGRRGIAGLKRGGKIWVGEAGNPVKKWKGN